MNNLERIESLPPELIAEFRKSGTSVALPKELQLYIKQLDKVIEIRDIQRFDNITRIARELRKSFPELSIRQAKERVYDAYNLFHVNSTIANEAWDNVFADLYMDVAKLCIAKGNDAAALKAIDSAYKCRTNAENRFKLEDLQKPILIISNKLSPEDLGYDKANLHDIAKRAADGHYAKLINSLTIDDNEKKRLYKDADIQDAETIDEYDRTN